MFQNNIFNFDKIHFPFKWKQYFHIQRQKNSRRLETTKRSLVILSNFFFRLSPLNCSLVVPYIYNTHVVDIYLN